MDKMKAALHDGIHTVKVSAIDKPMASDEDVIIAVRAAGICGSDLLMNNDKTEPDNIPAGHEVAGEIVEIGPKIQKSLIGTRVAVETIGEGLACASCWYCQIGQYRQCLNKV